MEKYSSKIGVLTFLMFILACLITMASLMVWIITGIWAFSLVMGLVLVVLVIPAFFGTNYSLTEEAIVVNCGIFAVNKRINYKDIIAISPTINNVLAPSLNSERVMVAYMKNNQLKRTYLSPCAFDRFICTLSDIVIEKTSKEEVLLPAIDENLANKETEKVEKAETKPKVRKISKSTKDKSAAESAASTKNMKLTLAKADNKTSKQEEKPKAKTTNKKQTSKGKETKITKTLEDKKETTKKKATTKQTNSNPKKTVKASKDEIVSELINTKELDENIEKIVSLLEQTTSQIDEISTQSINETKNKKSGKKAQEAQNKTEVKQISKSKSKTSSAAKKAKKTEEIKVASKKSSKNTAIKKQPIKTAEKQPQKKTVVRRVKKEN